MPKTKLESVVFTAITAWTMVYIMTLYNKVIDYGSFTNICPRQRCSSCRRRKGIYTGGAW